MRYAIAQRGASQFCKNIKEWEPESSLVLQKRAFRPALQTYKNGMLPSHNASYKLTYRFPIPNAYAVIPDFGGTGDRTIQAESLQNCLTGSPSGQDDAYRTH